MDEAKLREDALKAQVLSFEKDNCALKDQKKSVSDMTLNFSQGQMFVFSEINSFCAAVLLTAVARCQRLAREA